MTRPDEAYLPLGLLQASVVMRLVGDLTPDAGLRQLGGLLGVMAIALYAVAVAFMIAGARRKPLQRVQADDPGR